MSSLYTEINVLYAGSRNGGWVRLTWESLFEILARSKTIFLDPKFSRDFRETRESKLVARLASRESHKQKFNSENCEKRVLLRNFVAKIASYEPRRKKFRRKTSFSRVLQTNFVVRLASLANRNFIARLARIITNFNSGVLRESCENFSLTLISRCELWLCLLVSLANARLTNCENCKLDNISHFSLLARLVRLTRLALIFSRDASLIFYKILVRKIAKEDSLSTLGVRELQGAQGQLALS